MSLLLWRNTKTYLQLTGIYSSMITRGTQTVIKSLIIYLSIINN